MNDDRQRMQKVFAGLQFDLMEMAGGTAVGYVAAETFDVDYRADVDAQSEAGLVGGSAGNSSTQVREALKLFQLRLSYLSLTSWKLTLQFVMTTMTISVVKCRQESVQHSR